MAMPQHCLGFQQLKHLESFMCSCPSCVKKFEIFSDESDKKCKCYSCGNDIDFTKCRIEGKA